MGDGPFALVRHMAAIFDDFEVAYVLGGSMASRVLDLGGELEEALRQSGPEGED